VILSKSLAQMETMNENQERVVLVHGIWMTGLEMFFLRRRMRACGFEIERFHYASLGRTPVENAALLADFIRGLGAERLHLVAHSLGGIVLMHLFDRFPDLPPGRVVLLGSPVQGSGVARRLSRLPLLRHCLGRSIQLGLLGDVPPWQGGRELGVIAGTGGIGIGTLVGGLERPSDGTVAVAETRLAAARDYCDLPASHTGLLFSSKVADAVCCFLKSGHFTQNLHSSVDMGIS
jgi:pimeloyl-ACP methyl ester carboxylesterase